MAALVKKKYKQSEQETKLYMELDKGIGDMERGDTISHNRAMEKSREGIKSHGV